MKVIVDGTTYTWDPTRMLYSEAAFLQKTVGMKLTEWQKALQDQDVFAAAGLVYLMKKRAGETPDWDTLDFDVNTIRYIPESTDEVEEPAPKEDGPASAA